MEQNSQQQHKKSIFADYLAHFIFILIIFVLPELVMAIAMPNRHGSGFYANFYIKTLIYIGAFYLNFFVIVDRTLGRGMTSKKIIRFALINLLIILAGVSLCWLVNKMGLIPHRGRRGPALDSWRFVLTQTSFYLRDAVMMVLSIGLAVALRLSSKWKDLQQQHKEVLATQRATELDNLKSQLNPHFLFNTLNTIYALIAVNQTDAQKAVHRLSGLLRYMLYEDGATVNLKQETDFIENYVDLMRLRMPGRSINVNINLGNYRDVQVPPLLLVPLVENAFKHGHNAPTDTPIDIKIEAGPQNIRCTVSNDFTPSQNDEENKRYSGIGLANLRRRLMLLYGSNATLNTTIEGNTFIATVTVPLTV